MEILLDNLQSVSVQCRTFPSSLHFSLYTDYRKFTQHEALLASFWMFFVDLGVWPLPAFRLWYQLLTHILSAEEIIPRLERCTVRSYTYLLSAVLSAPQAAPERWSGWDERRPRQRFSPGKQWDSPFRWGYRTLPWHRSLFGSYSWVGKKRDCKFSEHLLGTCWW